MHWQKKPQYMLCGPQLISQLSMPSDTTSLSKMAAALPALPRRNTAPPAPEDVLGPIYSLATTSTLSGQAATAEKAYDNASASSSITHVHTFESDLDQEMYAELQVQDTPQRLLPATDNTSQIDTANATEYLQHEPRLQVRGLCRDRSSQNRQKINAKHRFLLRSARRCYGVCMCERWHSWTRQNIRSSHRCRNICL